MDVNYTPFLKDFRNKQINHARNIWDRAISILPRATQFWLKYSYMEELVGNIPGARQVRLFFCFN